MNKLLIIEDDAATLTGLKETFEADHFEVTGSLNGASGFDKAKRAAYDLIILDLVLPDMNGIDICKNLRKEGITTPILMLTGKKEEIDIVLGFEIGADDYVTKPFSINQLKARVRAILRRKPGPLNDLNEFSFGDVYINFKGHDAKKGNRELELSNMEFKVLRYFIQHEGEVIDRNTLLDEVWGYENYPSTRTVDNFILSLRKKIEDDPAQPKHILTLHGAGYKFVK